MNRKTIFATLVGSVLAAMAVAAPALACGSDEYSDALGICWPKCGGSVCGAIQHGKDEAQGQVLGNPLEGWLNASRNNSMSGAMPIPSNIRAQLTGYIDEDTLNRARYQVGENGVLNTAHVVHQFGDPLAITLIDVIVFRGPTEAQDVALWAHELTHVKQFHDWGTHNFAIGYAKNPASAEDGAYAKGDGYWAWRNAQANRGGGSGGYLGGPPPPQTVQWTHFCQVPAGRFGPYPGVVQVGAPCWAMTPFGPQNGFGN